MWGSGLGGLAKIGENIGEALQKVKNEVEQWDESARRAGALGATLDDYGAGTCKAAQNWPMFRCSLVHCLFVSAHAAQTRMAVGLFFHSPRLLHSD